MLLIEEFKELAESVFTYVDSWDAPEIDPNTYHLYGQKPSKYAMQQYIEHVRSIIVSDELIQRVSYDVQNHIYSPG